MRFCIITGNHHISGITAMGDLVVFLKKAIEECGFPCDIHFRDLTAKKVTLVLEGFEEQKVVDTLHQLIDNGGKLIPIFTEVVTGDTMNRFSKDQKVTFTKEDVDGVSRSEHEIWKIRFDHFCALARKAQYVWVLHEGSVDALKDRLGHDRVGWLPFGYCEANREVQLLPISDRDHDFSFFGRLTERRLSIVEGLQARGFSVLNPSVILPRYVKNDLLGRVKINLWMRLTTEWGTPSPFRSAHLLNNFCCQMAETSPMATYIDPYVVASEPEKFFDACAEAVESQCYYDNQLELIHRFREEWPMRGALGPLIERSLNAN